MTRAYQGSDELLARTANFVDDHRDLYLSSGGAQGHIMGFAHVGVPKFLPSLLLQTVGRKSGRTSIVPLIYGCHGGEWVVVGSKGGAPDNPAWYLNLRAQDRVVMQIATQAFEARWRELDGEEYESVWDYMAGMFPPYHDYRAAVTSRSIPVVKLLPTATAPVLNP